MDWPHDSCVALKLFLVMSRESNSAYACTSQEETEQLSATGLSMAKEARSLVALEIESY
jgi:hypothetical protein